MKVGQDNPKELVTSASTVDVAKSSWRVCDVGLHRQIGCQVGSNSPVLRLCWWLSVWWRPVWRCWQQQFTVCSGEGSTWPTFVKWCKSGFLLASWVIILCWGWLPCSVQCWAGTRGLSCFSHGTATPPPPPRHNNQRCHWICPDENHCDRGILISNCVVAVGQPLMPSLYVNAFLWSVIHPHQHAASRVGHCLANGMEVSNMVERSG